MKPCPASIDRAAQRAKLVAVFLFVACGYLLPKATRFATRKKGLRGTPVPPAQADAGEPRFRTRPWLAPIVGGTAALILFASTSIGFAGSLVDASTPPLRQAVIKVNYADTLLGIQAMFAVRACSAEDSPYQQQVGLVAAPPAKLNFIEEELTAEPKDVVVRVFDVDGREIARHDGAADVCGFARLAAAFVAKAAGRMPASAR